MARGPLLYRHQTYMGYRPRPEPGTLGPMSSPVTPSALHPVTLPPASPDDDDDNDSGSPILTTGQEPVHNIHDKAFQRLAHGDAVLPNEHRHAWRLLSLPTFKLGKNGRLIWFRVEVCDKPYKAHDYQRDRDLDVRCLARRLVRLT